MLALASDRPGALLRRVTSKASTTGNSRVWTSIHTSTTCNDIQRGISITLKFSLLFNLAAASRFVQLQNETPAADIAVFNKSGLETVR